MLRILSLFQFLRSAPSRKALMTIICTRGSYSNKTSSASPSRPFGDYFCRSHMEAPLWDTLVVKRHTPCSPHTTIGQECTVKWNAIAKDATHANQLSPNPTFLVYTHHCLFLLHHGQTSAWISF